MIRRNRIPRKLAKGLPILTVDRVAGTLLHRVAYDSFGPREKWVILSSDGDELTYWLTPRAMLSALDLLDSDELDQLAAQYEEFLDANDGEVSQ